MKSITILLLILTCSLGWSQKQYPPRDESGKDKALSAFTTQLKLVIKNKDGDQLLKMISPTIQNGFGGDDGLENFKTSWKPKDKTSELWIILNRIVNLGGVFMGEDKSSFVYPYIFALEGNDLPDPFSMMLVTGTNVNVREKPDLKGKVITMLSYVPVEINYEKSVPINNPQWYFITTPDKKVSGFMFADFLYSPIGYRMFLSKQKGKWLITSLVAGD